MQTEFDISQGKQQQLDIHKKNTHPMQLLIVLKDQNYKQKPNILPGVDFNLG
jgi:hypothetical protein